MRAGGFQIVFIAFLLLLSACGPVDFDSKKNKSEIENAPLVDDPNPQVPDPPAGAEVYFKMAATYNGVDRSSELKWESGRCYLDNFYDFPDWIFEDSSLDNRTETDLATSSCQRLEIARLIKSAHVCSPTSVALTAAERAVVGIDSSTLTAFSTIFPALAGTTAADLVDAGVSLSLSADCLCSANVIPPGGAGYNASLTLPPPLALCAQKFPVYIGY